MLFTRNLKQIIENYKNTLSDKAFESLNRHIHNVARNLIAELSQLPQGIVRGKRVHQLIEAEIEKSAHIPVTCHKGCSACCHLEVEITADDAAVLAQAVNNGVHIDRMQLAERAKRVKHDALWARPINPDNRCLFLGADGACRVYESRPAACRKLSVVSDPELCATFGAEPEPRIIPMAEVIISAAISSENNPSAQMAKMLKLELDRLEEKPFTMELT